LSRSPEPVVIVASAEFTLKSSPVRRTLEQRLIDDLRFTLTRDGFSGFRIGKDAARLVIHGLSEAKIAAQLCSKVFGVAYAAPATLLPASMEPVLQSIVNLASTELQAGQSFAIRAHRSTPSPLSRRDIEIKGGSEVLHALKDKGVRVGLGAPDVTFQVDLADDGAYLYHEKLQGPGGLPLSSQWKMLAVLDSGPLSLLAAYAMMRRGCLVELLIPVSTIKPDFAKESQLKLAGTLRQLVTRPTYRAFTVDFDKMIAGAGEEANQFFPSRDLMRSSAAKFAKEKKFKGLIFADIAGRISLVHGLAAAAPDLPVFTPLIGLDSQDLVDLARLAGISLTGLLTQVEPQIGSEIQVVDISKGFSSVVVEQLSL
jgi:thiamine biosynthesis protein ThiI